MSGPLILYPRALTPIYPHPTPPHHTLAYSQVFQLRTAILIQHSGPLILFFFIQPHYKQKNITSWKRPWFEVSILLLIIITIIIILTPPDLREILHYITQRYIIPQLHQDKSLRCTNPRFKPLFIIFIILWIYKRYSRHHLNLPGILEGRRGTVESWPRLTGRMVGMSEVVARGPSTTRCSGLCIEARTTGLRRSMVLGTVLSTVPDLKHSQEVTF